MSMHHEQQFASDNYSGLCPEALEYINKANSGHDYPYGDDYWTGVACDLFRDFFETDCEVFFVNTGTAANSLALSSLCQSYHSIICHFLAHIETDECGAVEFYSNGAKLLLADGANGKILPENIESIITKRDDIHYPKPRVVSLTQATEVGTVYNPKELLDIYKVTKKHNLRIHMDGARFANAVAALGVTPKEVTWQCGVDVLCFGGTKNGLLGAEAIVFFNKAYAEEFAYRCKQSGQLASKMRFIAAQWAGLLKTGAWLKHAKHANDCRVTLMEELKKIDEIKLLFEPEVNSIFIEMPEKIKEALHAKGWHFYTFIGAGGVRLMCSWDTKEESIKALVKDIKEVIK